MPDLKKQQNGFAKSSSLFPIASNTKLDSIYDKINDSPRSVKTPEKFQFNANFQEMLMKNAQKEEYLDEM